MSVKRKNKKDSVKELDPEAEQALKEANQIKEKVDQEVKQLLKGPNQVNQEVNQIKKMYRKKQVK